MNTAETPFEFVTVSYLTRIGNQSAGTLAELLRASRIAATLRFFITRFRRLAAITSSPKAFRMILRSGCSRTRTGMIWRNSSRRWTFATYVSIAALRSDLCRVVRDYCGAFPDLAGQSALERFYFCESVEVTVPLDRSARTLDEFRDGIEHLSHAGFYFHFISSRLRLQLQTNDFSHWLADGLGLKTLADSVNHIDIYTNTLDSARAKLLRLIDREGRKA